MEEYKPTLVQEKLTKDWQERTLRYPSSPSWQRVWKGWLGEEISFIKNEIKWFEDFLKRQWSDYETSEAIKMILMMHKKRKQHLEESLERGDYADA